jgi:hypothetical protein
VRFSQQINADVKISCEFISNFDAGFIDGILKSCDISPTAKIESTEATISSTDTSISRLNLSNNKQVIFLPEKVDEKFPNLLHYQAKNCAVSVIAKKNFKGLEKLKKLNLWGNQIERIPNNAFEDLKDLEVLSLGEFWCYACLDFCFRFETLLGENKIKFMNGLAFQGLNELSEVYLQMNVCIDNFFTYRSAIATMPDFVTGKCGFIES